MRPLLVIDLTSAARALLRAQPGDRRALASHLLRDADFGDRYTRRFGRAHAEFGDGTLANAARKRAMADEPTLDNVQYCWCLELILQAVAERRAANRRLRSLRVEPE